MMSLSSNGGLLGNGQQPQLHIEYNSQQPMAAQITITA